MGQTDAYVVAEDLIGTLFEKLEEKLQEKQLDRLFKPYTTYKILKECSSAVKLTKLTSDQFHPIYDYDDESMEPVSAQTDNTGKFIKVAQSSIFQMSKLELPYKMSLKKSPKSRASYSHNIVT